MGKEISKETVSKRYGDIARRGAGCGSATCGPTDPAAYAGRIGYGRNDLVLVPEGANLGLGCGNPVALAALREGQVVLDLGSGAGLDAFLAARIVGETGKVIGVDLTPEMVRRAQENAERGNYKNVEFRLGDIENLPVADESVDVVISNCVINLAPDKEKVFREAYRVLKKGGKLMVSDIVLERAPPKELSEDIEAYIGCIAGASLKEQYLASIRKAGFRKVRIIGSTGWALETNDVQERIAQGEGGGFLLRRLGGDVQKAIEVRRSINSVKVSAVK